MNTKSILVPFDGSRYSKRALDEAIKTSKISDAQLHLMMAVNSPKLEPTAVVISGVVRGSVNKAISKYVNEMYERANHMMEENVEYCKKRGVEADYKVVPAIGPAKAILDLAKKKNVDLIIMGSQGLRGIQKLKVLGSVSRHVLENATCPVTIVH
ncbi:MAG: universal stress protein [Candidatus Nitrosotalea sp.]|nr:universal stress protein [Candidatus Nitrosotalea sp.]